MKISWFPTLAKDNRPSRRQQQRRRRFAVEPLEGRQMLSTFTVTSTADSGPGSLRQAIISSDAVTGPSTIAFNISGGAIQTISPLSPLPTITSPVTIDGTSQPNSFGSPVIRIDGAKLSGSGAIGLDLAAAGSGSTVKGLTVSNFHGEGLLLDDASNISVVGDDIGFVVLNSGATSVAGNSVGVVLQDGASHDTLNADVVDGGNVGVQITGAATGYDTVQSCEIGTDPTGTVSKDSSGASLGNGDGVDIIGGASNNILNGDVVSNNRNFGIEIAGSGTKDNLVQASEIGSDATGSHSLGNATDGVNIQAGATNNTVGGTAAAVRDIISGNGQYGVYLNGSGTTGNVVTGDYIGTDRTGSHSLGNATDGVSIQAGAASNTVGGTVAGAGDVISGNGGNGVSLIGSGTKSNVVADDDIGTDVTGSLPLGNVDDGVDIESGAASNTVGGTAAGASDVISGNGLEGVSLEGTGTSANVVAGDFLGTNSAGTAALGNGEYGVEISYGATQNTIGGTTAGSRDVLSANFSYGAYIADPGTTANVLAGDDIGTDVSGSHTLANGFCGVGIENQASNNTVGGTVAAARDIISGNDVYGVCVGTDGTTGNVVEGDYIGTNAAGTAAVPNGNSGVYVGYNSSFNTIGGTVAGSANVISGNVDNGVAVASGTYSDLVEGDFIGTRFDGTAAVPNGTNGVEIQGGTTSNTVGGTTSSARDVISGNGYAGVLITDSGTSGNVVEGDDIGTNAAGTAAVPNAGHGVVITAGATANTIGGAVAGARDVISGNGNNGVALSVSTTSGNVVEGDDIGTNAAGTAALGNGYAGVFFSAATGNTIGGTVAGSANVISGNQAYGVYLASSASNNVVEGDDIGTDPTGSAPLGNGADGVRIQGGSAANTIGGTTAGSANVISGNNGNGVYISDSGTMSNHVDTDYIGTDRTGEFAVPNQLDGVFIGNGASGNNIGVEYGDVISGNTLQGVELVGAGTDANSIQNSIIGLDNGVAKKLGNGVNGVYIHGGASYNQLLGNLIGGNTDNGVGIIDPGSTGNLVEGNIIGTNNYATLNLGNGDDGVFLDDTTGNTVIYNVLDYNAGAGVWAQGGAAYQNNYTTNYFAFNGDGSIVDLD